MFTKTNFVFSLLSTCLLFVACQKEEVPKVSTPISVPSIYAHMEGTFYTQRISSFNYTSGATFFNNKDTSDIGLEISVQNDTLIVLDRIFLIDSLSQTSFSKTWRNQYSNDPQEITLEYYSNYDSIKFFTSSCGPVNGCRLQTYRGVRSANLKKGSSSDLYTLKVVHREHVAAIDTQYTADLVVNVDDGAFEIGTNLLYYNSFYTYSMEYRISGTGYESSEKLVYMDNDSLYIDYYVAKSTNDTIYYSYQGVKK